MKQKRDNKTLDIDDIFVWPDGTWCYRIERDDYLHMSDDLNSQNYSVVFFGTREYDEFFINQQNR